MQVNLDEIIENVLLKNKSKSKSAKINLDRVWYYTHRNTVMSYYDKYKLANKCKAWAIDAGNGYCIKSFMDFDGTWFANISGGVSLEQSFSSENEPEAIFKATDWVINTIKED